MKFSIPKPRNSLYWKISSMLFLFLVILATAYVFITTYSSKMYFQETNQRLNASVAEHIVHDVSPFLDGKVNHQALEEMFHYVMVIHPSIEVYLLSKEGEILSYFAPDKKIKLNHIDLVPLQEFIESEGKAFVLGDDPRNPNVKKVFSSAPVIDNEELVGYIYVILASEEYDSITQFLLGSYILRIGTRTMLITLIAALIIGLLCIWLITKNLNTIIDTVNSFQQGDLHARINLQSKGELTELANTFNEMANTILTNMNKIEDIEKLRRELIANVSHDLRTPLTTIHGYVETLMMKESTISKEDRKHYMTTILKSSEKLTQMVEDLFQLSKLEAKQIKPKFEPFFIAELIQDIIHKYSLTAKEKDIEIRPVFIQDSPLVCADVALIDRVLQNLVDNAIRFTPKGGVITIELNKKNDDYIVVKVTDTGTGISQEEISRIFDRYHKHDDATSEGDEGAGLGLTIVKNILDLHKVSIDVQSKENIGTSFYFSLPFYCAKKQEQMR